jgi:DedD protein
MARTISDEELQLKRRARRRLIGAVVLVAAIVVVLPMVLDSEPRQNSQTVSVQIPSSEPGGLASKAVPPAPAPESKAAPKPMSEPPPTVPVSAEPVKAAAVPQEKPQEPAKEAPAEPVVKAEPEKSAAVKPQAKTVKAPANSDGKYVVQVIALADVGKAKQMQGQIAAAGIKSYTEVVKTSKGDVTRVRAGPFTTRAAAEKAREQLKTLGMNGNVTTR